MYDYKYEMTGDVLNAIREAMTPAQIAAALHADRDNLEQDLNDAFWIDDDVTGNGSGMYTDDNTARGYILENLDKLQDLVSAGLMEAERVLDALADGSFAYLDVCVRCNVLYEAIYDALDLLEEDPEIAAEIEKLQQAEEAAG